jgi:hypothetical protein
VRVKQSANKSKKITVIIVETEKDTHGEYIPCVVKEGESGYYITTWKWGTDKKLAEKLADDYNKRLGLSKEEVMQLTLESMRRGVANLRSESNGVA